MPESSSKALVRLSPSLRLGHLSSAGAAVAGSFVVARERSDRGDRSPACSPSIASATLTGAVGRAVSVEVHVSNGLPGFTIVGLPDAAVREARDRVRAAVLSSGLSWPLRRVTVNLAPSGYGRAAPGSISPSPSGSSSRRAS